ncbi:MAG: ABC transporter ATP-binding protein [bacterium]
MQIVEVRNLSKRYPSFLLNHVSFALERGRICGFIGRNGAGKSTTIKAMLNLVHPEGGEIRYFGLPLTEHEAEIKRRIGYSTGAVSWYPRKPLRELAAVTRAFYPNWDESAYRAYLNLFGLDEGKKPIELSEGMKVKANLLLALSHRAEVLILDEPTSGLDPFAREELLELFLTLRERGLTILFSTHITSDLERCADDILYLRAGELQAASPREALLRRYGRAGETLEELFLRLEKEGMR